MNTLRDLMPLLVLGAACIGAVLLLQVYSIWSNRRQTRAVATEWPKDLPPMDEYAKDLIRRHSLPAALAVADAALPISSPTTTLVGGVTALGKGDAWPVINGRPLHGMAQFNLTESPFVPEGLREFAFVAVFFDLDLLHKEAVVLAYPSLSDLAPLPEGAGPQAGVPVAVRFRTVEDPTDHYGELYRERERRALSHDWAYAVEVRIDELEERDEALYECKLGGWPAVIQNPLEHPILVQVGSCDAARLNIVDGGCVYIWREAGEWRSEVQFF